MWPAAARRPWRGGWSPATDATAAIADFAVACPIRLQAPGDECALVGVNPPDLQIAAALILAQLFFDVVIPCRRRPDLHHQRHRLLVDLQPAGGLEQALDER